MTVTRLLFVLVILGFIQENSSAQRKDTLKIDGSKVNTAFLKPGTNRYLVYFKMGKDSSRTRYQLWSRKIDFLTYQGKEAITVTQEWEDNTGVIHLAYSVNDRKSFAPLYHESNWLSRGTAKADFVNRQFFLRDTLLTSGDTARSKKNMFQAFSSALEQNVLNWHIDLETFPILPYRDGVTFLINFYDPGFSAPKWQPYTVNGSGQLTGYDGQQIDCWLLTHESDNNKEIFWISKKTHEVLKLEQEFGGRFRYKIKLGYSI